MRGRERKKEIGDAAAGSAVCCCVLCADDYKIVANLASKTKDLFYNHKSLLLRQSDKTVFEFSRVKV